MNLRQEKILRLQTTQKGLRDRRSSREVLQAQQRALKENLLRRVPFRESQHERVLRLRASQAIKKKLILKRQKEREERVEIAKRFQIKTMKGLFFPKVPTKSRRR